MSFEDRPSGPHGDLRPITPRNAFEEWIEVVDGNTSGSTADSYRRRVKTFIEWCEDHDILNLNVVDGRDIKDYRDFRAPRLAETSLKNELQTVRQFLQYGVALEAVEPALTEKLTYHIPSLSKGEESSDLAISRQRAHAIIDYLDRFHYATRNHAMFLLLWDTGARISGIRALDLEDFDPDQETVVFKNRSQTGTRLKNGRSGERMNVIDSETVQVLEDYIREHRLEKTDEYGRSPLFTSKFSRISTSTVRRRTYYLTHPCNQGDCPHGEDPDTCEYREHGHESKCPSSMSPHPIRTGRITDLRNRGLRAAHVAGRVDATPETIRAYYDKPDLGQDLDRRRDAIAETGL